MDSKPWMPWDGNGKPPVSCGHDAVVEVMTADGMTESGHPGLFYWEHRRAEGDIVAYRVITEGVTRVPWQEKCLWVQPDSPDPRRAPALLDEAARIMEERGKQYDQSGGERSMGKVVAAFNIVTGQDLTEVEGWYLMELLKDVRFFSNTETPHADSLTDKIAYAALKAEAALRGA